MPFATYDPNTNKICANKGKNFDYYHELAHRRFQEEQSLIIYIGQMSEFYTIIFIVMTFFINLFKYLDLIGILIMITCFIYEEVYCNIKAQEKIKIKKTIRLNE